MPGFTFDQLQKMGATPMQQDGGGAAPQQGLTLQQLQQQGAQPANQDQSPSVGGFLGNVVNSAGNFIGGIGQAIMHPIDTVKNLGSAAVGGVQELSNAVGGTNIQTDQTKAFDNIKNYFGGRYGSWDNFFKTAYTDPVGFLADASMLASGVGGLTAKLGKFADLGTVAKAGEAISAVGEAANPLSIAAKPFTALGKGFEGLQNSLEETNLRLTPTQKTNLGSKVNEVTSFISDNLPAGTPEGRYNSVTNIYNEMERTIQKTLQQPDLQNPANSLPKADIVARLEKVPDNFRNDTANYAQVQRQVNEIVKTVETSQPDTIPLSALNDSKRSFFGPAFDSLGVKLKSEVKLAIGDVYKNVIEESLAKKGIEVELPQKLQPLFDGQETVPIKDFNQKYGTVITARKFLKLASGKPETGLVGRILSGAIGGTIGGFTGGPIGGAIGAFAGETAAGNLATPLRSAAGKVASATGGALSKATTVSKPALIAGQSGALSRAASEQNRRLLIRRPSSRGQ